MSSELRTQNLVLCLGLMALLGLATPRAFAAGDPICAKASATLRKGPGFKFPVSWKVARYMPFLRLENKNGWSKVRDVDGETHWAQAHDLTSSISCVVVKSVVASLRQKPSANADYADLRTLDRYTPLKKLELNGEWLKVEDETGRQAWINASTVWRPVKIQAVRF